MISAEEVRRRLTYDPLTGVFVWAEPTNGATVGDVAGHVKKNGYRYICLGQREYLAHRLTWLVMTGQWPAADIDHIDRKRDNNSFSNLRAATRSQNLANAGKKPANTSGFKGVGYHKGRGRYRARISYNYRDILIGYFDNPETASKAYQAKAKQLYGEFAATS